MSESKEEAYARLVADCRACRACSGVENVGDPRHPSPWAEWRGALDADLVIVGQDFSSNRRKRGPNRRWDPDIPTNKNLDRFLAAAEIEPDRVYLTNAMLCLKEGERLSAPVHAAWFT